MNHVLDPAIPSLMNIYCKIETQMPATFFINARKWGEAVVLAITWNIWGDWMLLPAMLLALHAKKIYLTLCCLLFSQDKEKLIPQIDGWMTRQSNRNHKQRLNDWPHRLAARNGRTQEILKHLYWCHVYIVTN